LAAAAWGLWYWDRHHRVKVEYYAHFVNRWGIPSGIDRLTEEQTRRRHHSFKFYTRGGRVEKVEVVNGLGNLTADHSVGSLLKGDDSGGGPTVCRYEFKRNEQGELTEEVMSDRTGKTLWVLHYTNRSSAHYTDQNGFPR